VKKEKKNDLVTATPQEVKKDELFEIKYMGRWQLAWRPQKA